MASVQELLDRMHKDAEEQDRYLQSLQEGKQAQKTHTKKSAGDLASRITQEAKAQAVSDGIVLPKASTSPLAGVTVLPSSPQQAARDFAYASERIGAGLLGAVEGVTDIMNVGIGKAVQGVTSLGGLAPNPVSEWGKNWADTALNTSPTKDWEESIRRRYNPTQFMETVTGVEQAIAQMLPGIGAARAVSAVGQAGNALNAAQAAGRGANAGRALFGLQAAGQSAQQAKQEGATTNEALAYGAASGLLESAIEGIAGGIPALGKGRLNDVVSAVTKNPVLNRAADIAGEGAEEALSTAVTPYLQRAMYNPDAENATPREILQSAALGSLAAGVLQGGLELPSYLGNQIDTRNRIRNIAQENLSNQDFVQESNRIAAQSAEQRINQRKITPEQNLLLYNNPLMNSMPTAEEAQQKQPGSPVYQGTGIRQYLPNAQEPQVDQSSGQAETPPRISNSQIQSTESHRVSTPTIITPINGRQYNGNKSYRMVFSGESPISSYTGYAMFADDPNQIESGYGSDFYTVDNTLLPNISKFKERIAAAWNEDAENGMLPFSLESYAYDQGRDGAYVADSFDPENIVDSANAWDDPDLISWAFEKGIFDDVPGVKTSDGAIVFDGNFIQPGNFETDIIGVDNEVAPFSTDLQRAVSIEDTSEIYDIYGSGRENLPETAVGANKASPWGEFVASSKEFFPEGANAARDVDVPTTDPQGRRIRKTAATAMGAKAIPDEAIADIQNMVLRGELSYNRVSDKSSIDRATKTIQDKGYQGALEEFRNSVSKGVVSKDIATLGQQLLINAANAGDGKTTAELLTLYAQMETTAGQAVQAASILRKLSPTAQLYAAQKAVDNLNKTIGNKKGRRPSAEDNVPVEIWMQRVGENLADELSRMVNAPKDKAKSVSETILSDLRKFANESAPKRLQTGKKRSNIDRIVDLFQNKEAYNEAWQAAKDTISDTFENDPDALAAFDAWLDSSLDYSKMLTKELTGQTEIMISESLVEEFLQQTDQAGRDVVLDKIYQNIADQVPSTWKDKWNAWRYLAMLGNPRTHIRNIAGNVFFQPLRIVKDRTAAAIEAGVSLASGGRLQRTKSFAANPALYKAAWNDWDNVRNVLSGNKYDDIRSEINSRRRIFRAKPLELARTGNSWLLEFEDTIFKRITYADALAGYLQANGVTAEQMRTNTVDANLMARARDYAGQEALRATYQDRNKVSDKVVQVANVLGPAGEAILPFKRTPANILVRGLEYSPAGLAKALTYDLIQVKRGNMTGAEAIDHIASGLTGSALFALGAYLFSQGIVTSGGGDDENQDRLNELTGSQNYALNLPGGGNVTLDWLAPEALPFFMGVELMDSMGQSGNTTDSIMTALKSVSDPMLELSMLQSLNDVIDSVSFSENKLGALASSAVVSYFTQAIPTMGGQFERTGEENRMSTYTDKALTIDLPGGLPEVGVPTDVQYAIGRASARIPGWDYQQIPYIDAWGREESNGPLVLRAGNNFLNPAYTSSLNVTPVDEEIQRLYTQTGDGGVVPDRPNRYITVNGERVDLSAEQYVQYATERGQMQFDMLDKLIDRSAYQRLTDSEKAAVISDVYQYADAVTKAEISDYQPDSWISKVQSSGVDPANYILYRTSLEDGMTLQDKDKAMTAAGITGNGKARLLIAENPDWADDAKEAGVTQNVFVEYKVLTSGLTGDKDAEGNTISGSKKAKVLDAINSMDIDSETKDALYYAAGYASSGIRDTPWH